MTETPIALREGRTCFFYVGSAGTVEAVTANQRRRERLARLEMLEAFENSDRDHVQDELG